ncbi:hypothetical protein A1O1_00245 [Capronia coronata CBS 617.96]|uniref:Zinc finger PHD-type domain-containing protein n=1 Tax=Capronia coronata CBS 617.96 TaxID=1182541 RepID=W9Z0N0_9EURO|nr:uncharacterized protein A1O1_00245 [Capronia coronata CBS 617.96]EXJ95126.1 hypothetical protein A1O1_00245 [Capronia coronata CBS 617.96]
MEASRPTPSRQRTADPDWAYFCENACLSSFSGCVDEDSTMTEQEISNYILYSKPELHERLDGIPLPSSYLPTDEYNNGRLSEQHQRGGDIDRTMSSSLHEQPGGTAEVSVSQSVDDNQLQPIETNAEGQAFEFVFDGYRFALHRHSDLDMVYCCSYPTCRNPMNVIPLGECYGSVTDEASNQSRTYFEEYPRTVYYCFDCLEQVLNHEFEIEMAHEILPQLVDGTHDNEMTLELAEKLHPLLDSKKFKWMYFPQEPPLTPGKDSNSKKGSLLRRQKQYEIERIIKDLEGQLVGKEEYLMPTRDAGSQSPDLRIHKRHDLSPFRDRYKKQGLEYCDLHDHSESGGSDAKKRPHTPDGAGRHDSSALRCFCTEPPDDDGMVHCSSTSCMFGAIHLRCSGLDNVACAQEGFVCKYCKVDGSACSGDNNCSHSMTGESESDSLSDDESFKYETTESETTEEDDIETSDELEELEEGEAEYLAQQNAGRVQLSGFTAVNARH